MEEDVLDLKEEISLLEKRIATLEKAENKRKAFNYIQILIKVILFLVVIYGIWYGYNYVVNEIPNILEEKIKEINPVDSITGIFKK